MRTRTRRTNTSTSKTISTGSRRSRTSTRIWRLFNFAPDETRNSPLRCCVLEYSLLPGSRIVREQSFLPPHSTRGLPRPAFYPVRTLRVSTIGRDTLPEFRFRVYSDRTNRRECRPDLETAEPSLRWGCRETHPS